MQDNLVWTGIIGRMAESLEGQVRTWLQSEGYPLEYAVAREFRRARLAAHQGVSYVDTDGDGKIREIDVLGEMRSAARTAWVVVECKASRLPWIVLTHESSADDWQPMLVSSSYSWRQLITATLGVPRRHGFSLVQALKKGDQDPAYAALNQTISAANGVLHAREREGAGFALPVLVISSPLFSLYVDQDGEESINEVGWHRMLWAGAAVGRTIVDVVTRTELPAYAKQIRKDFATILTGDTSPD